MLYISDIIGKKVFITNSDTNEVKKYDIDSLVNIFKQNHIAVGGLTYTPKKGLPRVEITTPLLICLDSLTVGSPCRLRLKKNAEYIQCIKMKSQGKKVYSFFDGNGKTGFFNITREHFIRYKDSFSIDIMTVDINTVTKLKKMLKNI